MNIKFATFITSAVKKEQYPQHFYKEIAFIGRSNVGKSSLINLVLNNKSLAKVSSTPGKTTLINFFAVNNQFCFVDLPGYGFAKRSKDETTKWGNMIEGYLKNRENLALFFLLLDIRRTPTDDDLKILKWLSFYGKTFAIVLTKVDKINLKERNQQIKIISEETGVPKESLILTSTLKKMGKDEILKRVETEIGDYLESIDISNIKEINPKDSEK
ncbi:YihA family ribosome biogenesis GTP-binding protein [bacterium]|nr:YihA family ribosome biogenesis GTP-binding protein [bacterium]